MRVSPPWPSEGDRHRQGTPISGPPGRARSGPGDEPGRQAQLRATARAQATALLNERRPLTTTADVLVQRDRHMATVITIRAMDEWVAPFDAPILAKSGPERFARRAHQILMGGPSLRAALAHSPVHLGIPTRRGYSGRDDVAYGVDTTRTGPFGSSNVAAACGHVRSCGPEDSVVPGLHSQRPDNRPRGPHREGPCVGRGKTKASAACTSV